MNKNIRKLRDKNEAASGKFNKKKKRKKNYCFIINIMLFMYNIYNYHIDTHI